MPDSTILFLSSPYAVGDSCFIADIPGHRRVSQLIGFQHFEEWMELLFHYKAPFCTYFPCAEKEYQTYSYWY